MVKKIIFYGGCQTGMVSLLTILALGHEVICVIPVDDLVEKTARSFNLNILKTKDINEPKLVAGLKAMWAHLIVCCNGKQIFKKDLLGIPAINLHANLYKYPGNNPIKKMLKDGETKASVGIHWMSEIVDGGELIIENFQEVFGKTEKEVYNELYPLYSITLVGALNKI